MKVMKKKELIMSTLEKMGYSPKVDDDGDVMIRYQLKRIYMLADYDDEEDSFLAMVLPQFYEIEDGKETLALAICNKMTRELKVIKVYVDQTFKNVSASCEFIYTDEKSLEQCIRRSLQMLSVVKSCFRDSITELSD